MRKDKVEEATKDGKNNITSDYDQIYGKRRKEQTNGKIGKPTL